MICQSLLTSSTMKSIWMTSRSDRPSPSSRTVFMKLKRTPTGSKIWLTSGIKQELLIMLTAHREEETTWRQEARSVIIHLRLQLPRSHSDHRFLKLSKRKVKTSLSGTVQSEVISKLLRIVSQDAWQTRYFVIMLSFVGSIQLTRSRSYWKRRPRSSFLQTTENHTRVLLSVSSRRKS